MPSSPIRFLAAAATLWLVVAGLLFGHGFDVLVFTRTTGATHSSTAAGVTALQDLGLAHDFGVTVTSDAATFTTELANHQVAVFLNTAGDILDAAQQSAFQSWYQSGGAFVGIHGATATEPSWPWFLDLLGAEFDSSSATVSGTVEFLDQVHPITNVTDPGTNQRVVEWTVTDQWDNFTATPRGEVHVLAHVDERSYPGGTMGDDHPIMWCREFAGGRSAFLGPGHESAVFSDPIYRDLLTNTLEWAAGELGGDSGATLEANFEKVILESNLDSPMSLDIAPDGTIYLVERGGAVKAHDEGTGITTTIGTLDEYSGGEYGVLGIALAPDFATSSHLYIMWSPNPVSETNTRVSRFTLDGSGNLDLASEVSILEFYTDRGPTTGTPGHHQAGCLRFDAAGNLYISTGDNATHSGYSPRDTSNVGNDGRKGPPNSNDLRGKILRITPDVGGGPAGHPNYTIPSGNLFAPGTSLAREEIFVMGCRNPFRFCLDPHTGWLYFGDVGPDSGGNGGLAFEGPQGHDEFNQVKAAGWFGWPYFLADNKAYHDGNADDWTVPTAQSDLASYFLEPTFTATPALAGDPALMNNPQSAWIWYPDEWTPAPDEFSELDGTGGRCAMAGAVYQWTSGANFPQYYNKSVFLMEWSRNELLEVRTREDGSVLEITEFAPHLTFSRPIEMKFGPNGTIYLIEWGTNFGGGTSSDTALVKVQYLEAAATPVAIASADLSSGGVPLTVNFSSAGSFDPDSGSLTFEWDFDGDQVIDSTLPNPVHTYTTAGTYAVQLTVTDNDLLFSRANLTISAGNFAPQVTFTDPADYSFFDWGDTISFACSVTDAEDGSTAGGQITGSDVLFESSLGHDDHQHNELQLNQLTGTVPVPRDASHPFDADLAYVLDAFYTDNGAPGVDPITSSAKIVLQPKVKMAQNHDSESGTQLSPTSDPVGGGQDVTSLDHGDFISFTGFNLHNISALRVRASAGGSGGSVEVRQDSPTGNLIATIPVTSTGDWNTYADFTAPLTGVLPGSHDLFLIATDTPGASDILRLNWINFRGPGSTATPNRPVVAGVTIPATDTIRLTFDQIMDHATLANAGHYTVSGGASLVSATPAADQLSVDLLLSSTSEDSYYSITLNALEDLAGDPIAPGSAVTAYYTSPISPAFVLGLNSGGTNYTDGSGNLFIDDTATYSTSGPLVTLLVDITRTGDGIHPEVPSAPADFAPGDGNIDLAAPVSVMDANPATNFPLTALNASGITFSNVNANGIFTTGSGTFNGIPLLDGYIYENATPGDPLASTATLSGLGEITTGQLVTLTLWGVGDTPNSDTRFQVFYNGSDLGVQATDYDTATPANTAPARVQYTFTKIAGVDDLTIQWGADNTETAGFSAFSLTSQNTSSNYYTANTNSTIVGDPIALTTDDPLYQSDRWKDGGFSYRIPLDPGNYAVHLKFAETFWTFDNARTFNVQMEGGPNLFSPDLDIHAQAGHDTALDFIVDPVAVTDGLLDIDFLDTGADNPKISAVAVFEQALTGGSLPDPSFAHYLSQNPESLFDPLADVDRDGLTTLLEYALAGDDETIDDALLPTVSPMAGNEYEMTFVRPAGLPDLTWTVLASATLSPASWIPLSPGQTIIPLGGNLEEVRFQNLAAAASNAGLDIADGCFFRLEISLQSPGP